MNALAGKPIPVYGQGLNVRDWLYVEDHADALLLDHWRSTNKWALGDVARETFTKCDLANPGGGGDAWTSGRGRDRCRVAQGDSIGSDRACFVTCLGHISAAHANVSLTQVLRDDFRASLPRPGSACRETLRRGG